MTTVAHQLTEDEFDLDLALGELDPHRGGELYLPSRREVPGETCDTHQATCPHTQCGATCPATCIRCPTEFGTGCATCRC